MKNSSETFIQRAHECEREGVEKRFAFSFSLTRSLALASTDTLFSRGEKLWEASRSTGGDYQDAERLNSIRQMVGALPAFARRVQPTNKRVWPTELPL
jgi:hypothetical protein